MDQIVFLIIHDNYYQSDNRGVPSIYCTYAVDEVGYRC